MEEPRTPTDHNDSGREPAVPKKAFPIEYVLLIALTAVVIVAAVRALGG